MLGYVTAPKHTYWTNEEGANERLEARVRQGTFSEHGLSTKRGDRERERSAT